MATVMQTNNVANDDHIRGAVSAEEWAVRVDLAAAYRLVALYGWDDLIFTHLSARVPGPEHHFLINPYDMMFEEITASSLVKIDVEGQPVVPTSHPVNPAGFVIHSALHMAREDAHAVMHLLEGLLEGDGAKRCVGAGDGVDLSWAAHAVDVAIA